MYMAWLNMCSIFLVLLLNDYKLWFSELFYKYFLSTYIKYNDQPSRLDIFLLITHFLD